MFVVVDRPIAVIRPKTPAGLGVARDRRLLQTFNTYGVGGARRPSPQGSRLEAFKNDLGAALLGRRQFPFFVAFWPKVIP